MKAVIALGGNALTPYGKEVTIAGLITTIDRTTQTLAALAQKWTMVIVFGSGPQVGALLLKDDIAKQKVPAMPLDVLDAEVQGQLGYLIEQSLLNQFRKKKVTRPVVSLLTQVMVSKRDAAFKNPSKPVGPFYSPAEVQVLKRKGWVFTEDAGHGFRRVVPSPQPVKIVEGETIRQLVSQGTIVLAAGGGGIPVSLNRGRLTGVEAVIDKDRAAAHLGRIMSADILLIVTSVDGVYLNYGTKKQKPIRRMTVSEAKHYLKEGQFAEGSMRPKIEASLEFLKNGGKKAIITDQRNVLRAVEGKAGTIISN